MQRKKRENKFKGEVNKDAERQREQRKGTGEWLNDSIDYTQEIQLSGCDEITRFFNGLVKGKNYKKDQKILDLKILLANLFRADMKTKPIHISRNVNDWHGKKAKKYSRSSAFTLELIDLLYEKGFIEMEKGYYMEKEKRKTRIWGTNDLLEIFEEIPKNVETFPPKETVVLKDRDGNIIDYKPNEVAMRVRKIVEKANKVNNQADIRIKGYKKRYKISVFLKAIFKGDFKHYGRLHSVGFRQFQGYSEDERAEFMINGDPVVEYDYSALHPHLLYAMSGIQYDEDPYLAVINDRKVRDDMKNILLRMINGKSVDYVIKNIDYDMMNDEDFKKRLKRVGIDSGAEIANRFLEAHSPIKNYLGSGEQAGLKTMNLDARIAWDVVKKFVDRGIPILPIHDSFIVQEQYGEELKTIMHEVYKKKTKGFTCPIK